MMGLSSTMKQDTVCGWGGWTVGTPADYGQPGPVPEGGAGRQLLWALSYRRSTELTAARQKPRRLRP
jgi:hypothetical protein